MYLISIYHKQFPSILKYLNLKIISCYARLYFFEIISVYLSSKILVIITTNFMGSTYLISKYLIILKSINQVQIYDY